MQSLQGNQEKKRKSGKRKKSEQGLPCCHDFPTLQNQPDRLINEAICLMSIHGSSVKLTRNNIFLFLEKKGDRQRKWMTVSSSLAYLHLRQKSLNGSHIFSACLHNLNVMSVIDFRNTCRFKNSSKYNETNMA